MQTLNTRYGVIESTRQMAFTEQGLPAYCTAAKPCPLNTPAGTFTPQHTTDDLRKKEVQPVTFHADGTIKSLPLEFQAEISTPAGDLPAELITFHKNGAVNRVFPLNGKLSGYWGQEDEQGLARPVTLTTPIGAVTARLISVGFHPGGQLRSLTLWPGETLTVEAPTGPIAVRSGLSFRPDGTVRSLEPAKPTPVSTPAGEIAAYDPDAVGVNGDVNSVLFHEDGSVARVVTTLTRIKAVFSDGRTTMFAPEQRDSLCGDDDREVIPMTVEFRGTEAEIRVTPESGPVILDLEQTALFAEPHLPGLDTMGKGLRCGI
jgi:hypothetical protein